jgi:HK97 family phage portal protein
MPIFSRKKQKVNDALSTSKSMFYSGPSTAGTFVTEQSAMQAAAVHACVRVISEAVASLPLHVYRYEDRAVRMVPEHPLYALLHNAPNPEMTSFSFREALMTHLLLHGNAYAQIIRDGRGQVIALYPLLPDKMDVSRGSSGEIYYTYWRDRDENGSGDGGQIVLRRDQVLHIPGLSFNGLVGLSPIALARNAVGMALATEEYGAAFFKNGATPGGLLEVPQTVKDPVKIRQTWDSVYKGANNANRIAVMEDGMKFHVVSVPPEQAQFLETRKFQLAEIARIFRVPLHMIGDLDKSSFSNIEQQSLEFVKYTLDPWVVRWEQALWQSLLLPGEQATHFIKFNLDGLLRGDYATRMNGYSTGIQNSFLCPNDIRRLENLNEIPNEEGGDEFMVNGSMVKLSEIGLAYKAKGGADIAAN